MLVHYILLKVPGMIASLSSGIPHSLSKAEKRRLIGVAIHGVGEIWDAGGSLVQVPELAV